MFMNSSDQIHRLGFGEFVALMALVSSLAALSTDAMLPAFPAIVTDLGIDRQNDVQFVISVLFLGMAVGQVLFGPISDSCGRKPAVYAGYIVYMAGCLLSMFSANLTMMLIGRFLQGFGIAGPRSVSMALIRDLHGGSEMARIMSFIMSVFILVPIVAPALGQGILLVADWRAIFGSFLLLSVISVIWFGIRQPETLLPARRMPYSLGRILSAAWEVMHTRSALGFTIAAGLASGGFFGYLSSSQQIFQDTYLVGDRFSLFFGILASAIGLATFTNGKMVVKFGMRSMSTWALRTQVVLSTAFFVLASLQEGVPAFWSFMVYMMITFFCLGILFGNLNALAMEPLGHIAGVGAAVVASLSLTISALLGAWIGQSYNGTVLPLVAGFGLLGLLSLGVMRWAAGGEHVQTVERAA
jgi:MFS transporter, DHA1 family, multidrug resistance protein